MGLTHAERRRFCRAIVFVGPTAVGKESVAVETTRLLGGYALVTGRMVRALADTAERYGLVQPDTGDGAQLKRGAIRTLLGLMRPDRRSIHFEPVSGDRLLHIFHGRSDMTERILPEFRKPRGLSNLEPLSAAIAVRPTMRRQLTADWRRAIREHNVTAVVAKRPRELLPEADLIVWLTADDERSAAYRLQRGNSVFDTPDEELAYIRRRNGFHGRNRLEDVPAGAFHIDMNQWLLEPDGATNAAGMVVREYDRRHGV